MKPLVDWKQIVGQIAIDFICDIISNNNETEPQEQQCEDLGYAIVLDENNEQKRIN